MARVRGGRPQPDFGAALGLSERTVRRMQTSGASLTQALALAGAEVAAGNLLLAVYVISMIGVAADLAPKWARSIPWRGARR